MSHQHTAQETVHEHQEHDHPHAVPMSILVGVFVLLLFFTFITVAVTKFDFGYEMNLIVAMVVALVKAVLVGLYFMHLRWDAPLNAFILVAALLFVTLFITFSLLDTDAYSDTQEQEALIRAAAAP